MKFLGKFLVLAALTGLIVVMVLLACAAVLLHNYGSAVLDAFMCVSLLVFDCHVLVAW